MLKQHKKGAITSHLLVLPNGTNSICLKLHQLCTFSTFPLVNTFLYPCPSIDSPPPPPLECSPPSLLLYTSPLPRPSLESRDCVPAAATVTKGLFIVAPKLTCLCLLPPPPAVGERQEEEEGRRPCVLPLPLQTAAAERRKEKEGVSRVFSFSLLVLSTSHDGL